MSDPEPLILNELITQSYHDVMWLRINDGFAIQVLSQYYGMFVQ